MKYLPLIWAGLWRKRLRTILTLLSIIVAFLLFGILHGVDAGLAHIMEYQRLDRLYADSRHGTPLPIADLREIESVPGVTTVAPQMLVRGYWQDQKNGVLVVGSDRRWFDILSETDITQDQIAAFTTTRTGAIVSIACAQKYGWKLGDKVPLTTNLARPDGTKGWAFDIVGIVTMEGHEDDGFTFMVVNYDYLDQGRADGKGTLSNYLFRIDDPAHGNRIAATIDALFANSSDPTLTYSQRLSGQSDMNEAFNVTFFTKSVIGAAFFTLLILTANTMTQSFNERVPEFAVLKTLGFSDRGLMAIVLTESLLLTGIGAGIGLVLAKFLMPLGRDAIGVAHIQPVVFLEGALIALAVSVVSGWVPGWRARRLNIVDALAGR
jgi:putative ABC transport system permease protein